MELTISPLRIGETYIFNAFVRDITERKRAEEQLHLQSSALEAAANAIVITDRKGTIQWAFPGLQIGEHYTISLNASYSRLIH